MFTRHCAEGAVECDLAVYLRVDSADFLLPFCNIHHPKHFFLGQVRSLLSTLREHC